MNSTHTLETCFTNTLFNIILPSALSQKSPAFYATCGPITAFTRAGLRSLSWARWIQYKPISPRFILILSKYLCLESQIRCFFLVTRYIRSLFHDGLDSSLTRYDSLLTAPCSSSGCFTAVFVIPSNERRWLWTTSWPLHSFLIHSSSVK